LEIGKNENKGFTPLKKTADLNRRLFPQSARLCSSAKGFTLVEVIISIGILSIGLVLILQGFAHSLNIIQITKNNTQASFLADEITTQFLLDSQTLEHSFSDKVNGETEIDAAKYIWDISVEPAEEQGKINQIISTVSWVSGRRKGKVSLFTYLGIFPDEKESEK